MKCHNKEVKKRYNVKVWNEWMNKIESYED